MSSNLDVVKKAYDDFTKGDVEAVIAACHNEVVFNEINTSMQETDIPHFKRLEGKGGAAKFFGCIAEYQQHTQFDMQSVFGDGTHFVALVHEALIWKPTGKSVEMVVRQKWEVDPDGKVLKFQAFPDTAKLMAAVN